MLIRAYSTKKNLKKSPWWHNDCTEYVSIRGLRCVGIFKVYFMDMKGVSQNKTGDAHLKYKPNYLYMLLMGYWFSQNNWFKRNLSFYVISE